MCGFAYSIIQWGSGHLPTRQAPVGIFTNSATRGGEYMSKMLVPDFLSRSLDRITSLASSFGYVEDAGVKGVLCESLVESFLEPLLMPPYRAGTGVIIDCQGRQSGQCDIIIWDDSIFRPLYMARGAGIFFIEAVVSVRDQINSDTSRL